MLRPQGINAIKTGKLVSLSEQELIDCDRAQDQGCAGGLMDYAFQFVINNGGIDTEEDYTYRAADGVCDLKKKAVHAVTIDGCARPGDGSGGGLDSLGPHFLPPAPPSSPPCIPTSPPPRLDRLARTNR